MKNESPLSRKDVRSVLRIKRSALRKKSRKQARTHTVRGSEQGNPPVALLLLIEFQKLHGISNKK